WSGIPETGFRGMYRSGGFDQWKPAYSFEPEAAAIRDLPISQWSSAGAAAEWSAAPAPVGELLSAELSWSAGQLNGTLTNHLDVPMRDWLLAHEGRVYAAETRNLGAAALQIAPGETLDLSNRRRVVPRVLQSYLTGVRRFHVENDGDPTKRDVVAAREVYDPLDRDPYTMLRIATFFAAARGDEFTALDNSGLRRLDLSP